MAAAVLFSAASCAKEDISSSIAGEETIEVFFATNLADLGTRAYDDGTNVNTLYYFVCDKDKNILSGLTPATPIVENDTDGKFSFSLNLIKTMEYNVYFWAQKGDAYSVNNGVVSIDYTNVTANNGDLDAFYGSVNIKAGQAGTTQNVSLRRPFAQLNALTSDGQVLVDSGVSGYDKVTSTVTIEGVYSQFNLLGGNVTGNQQTVTFDADVIPTGKGETSLNADYNTYLSMNYLFVPTEDKFTAKSVQFTFAANNDAIVVTTPKYNDVPLKPNFRTNILGALLTNPTEFNVKVEAGYDAEYDKEDETTTAKVKTAADFVDALSSESDVDEIILEGDINLNDLFASLSSTRAAADPSLAVAAGKTLTIDLGGNKLSATSTQTGKNYSMFNVKGSLTVNNGTIEYEHKGENMGWNSSTNIFDITAGGVLNLNGVTAKNLGGSDMGFVAHLNNWGEVTLNVDNCTLESNYVPVRVFNSGPDMNNVTIKNSTLKGGSAAFWVHNYTTADFGGKLYSGSSEAYDKERVAARLELNIYNQGNTFSPDINGIRYGFTNSIRTDAYGITKTVSEDGTEVTLGSIIENGLIRRGVAGAEENTTIKKVVVEEGVGVLYDRTFRRFYALETVELPNTLTTIGAAGSGVFQSCNNLKNIVLPESVTVLGKGSFQECSSLESINIPAGVTRIESDCLRATGLKEVEFHAGVTYFGAQAFRDCKQLTKVVINAPEFTMEGNTFGIMAAPFTPMTIEVANAEMKAYVESKLTANAKTYITVVIKGTVIVSNAVEFISAVNNVEESGTILVDESFNFTTEESGRTHNSGSWYDGIYYVGDKSFTIDLGGYTVGNTNGAVNDYLFNFKNAGTKANTITIKNGTLDAGTAAYCALCTSATQENQLTINLEDITLYNNISNGSTVKVRGGVILNVNNDTKIIGKDSYLGIENWNATVNVYDGAEIYMNGTTSYNGCLIGVGGNGTINVYGGYGKGVSGGLIAMTTGGTINVSGGEWIANTDGTHANSNKSVLVAQSDKQYNAGAGNAVVNVTGGTFKGGYNCYGNAVGDAQINITGGNFNNNPSYYVVEGHTATEANGIWTVQ